MTGNGQAARGINDLLAIAGRINSERTQQAEFKALHTSRELAMMARVRARRARQQGKPQRLRLF